MVFEDRPLIPKLLFKLWPSWQATAPMPYAAEEFGELCPIAQVSFNIFIAASDSPLRALRNAMSSWLNWAGCAAGVGFCVGDAVGAGVIAPRANVGASVGNSVG